LEDVVSKPGTTQQGCARVLENIPQTTGLNKIDFSRFRDARGFLSADHPSGVRMMPLGSLVMLELL
jgi:hypothetical protein